MVNFKSIATLSFAAAVVNAVPVTHQKRIAQVISDSTTQWVQACTKAGGAGQCSDISVKAFTTLLAAGDPCDHQNAADSMVDLAKTLNNDPDMIRLAQVFVQQPRNAPDSLSVLYCQKPPKNAELKGLFQCQFQGCNPKIFTGNVQLGAPGTIPLGHNVPLSPGGSCTAHPQGPIPDGTQLTAITTDPGVGSSGSGNGGNNGNNGNNGNSGNSGNGTGSSSSPDDTNPDDNDPNDTDPDDNTPSSTSTPDSSSTPDSTSSAPDATATPDNGSSSSSSPNSTPDNGSTPPPSDSKPFTLQNGKDAIALNQKFASLTPNSPCNDGGMACVDGSFAQCVGGKFALTKCSGGTICAALPLVNKAGTTIACTTPADRDARIAATGATSASSTDNGSSNNTASPTTSPISKRAPTSPAIVSRAKKAFTLQNGKDAKALNAKFAKLTATSKCTNGENACIKGAFAQCVGNKFVLTKCSGGLTCEALPLVNKAGTSLACTTKADLNARIAATGA